MKDFRLLRHLGYFLAVAEERHFGRAAKRLGISQPPLSTQIQILERTLGVQLFERSRTGVKLTHEAKAILPVAQSVARQSQRLESLVRELKAGRTTVLTVGAITTALFEVLPGVIRAAKEKYPSLALSLVKMDTSAAIAALQEGEIDLAFVRSDQSVEGIHFEPLFREALVVALPSGHPLAAKKKIDLKELAREPMVMFPREENPAYYDSIILACRGAGFSPLSIQEAASTISQIALVSCGVGVALMPEGLSKLATSNVVFRPLAKKVDVVTIAVSWKNDASHPAIPGIVALAKHC